MSRLRGFVFCVLGWVVGWMVLTAMPAQAGQTYLYRSDLTQQYFQSAGGDYSKLVEPWRAFAIRQSITLKDVGPESIGTLLKGDLLIMPAVVLLKDSEKQSLDRFVARGGSLLATWASGGRDATGAWLGYGWLKTMLGIDVVADIRQDNDERFLLPFGESVIATQIAASKRIYLMKTSEPLLRAKARYAVARFGDWARSVHTPNALAAAIAIDEIQGSRRAWIGAPETGWSSSQADMDKVLKDLVSWLHRKPNATLAAWPSPYQAALFIEMDTEDKFENAATLEKLFDERGLRGTFYMLTSEAVKHADLVRRIATKHEVGYHADLHTGFKGLSADLQQTRLLKMIADMKGIVGDVAKVTGFRAPLESYDQTTEQTLRKLGLRHHTADPSSTDSALPFLSKAEPGLATDDALVVLPRTLLDDINYVKMGLLAPGAVRGVLIESLRDNVHTRGLSLLSLHSQNFAPGSVLDKDVPVMMDEAVRLRDRLWIPVGEQLERWWRVREPVKLQTEVVGQNQLRFTVQNSGNREAKGLQVVLMATSSQSEPKVLTGPVEARLARQDEFRWVLSLPPLKQGSVTTLVVKL
jgi:Polysaccharide deacetylase/Beta-galactosidase trimerisation domain